MNRELVSFLLTGGLATLLQYVVLALGTDYLEWPASVASGTGYLSGAVLSYLSNYFFTFASDRPHVQAISRFLTMAAVGWCLTIVLMALLADIMGWNKWISQVLVTCFVLAWNFLISRTWVFSRTKI